VCLIGEKPPIKSIFPLGEGLKLERELFPRLYKGGQPLLKKSLLPLLKREEKNVKT